MLTDAGSARAHCKWGIPGMLIGDEELDFSRIEQAVAAYGAGADASEAPSAEVDEVEAEAAQGSPLFASTPLAGVALPTRMRNLTLRKGLVTVADLVANLPAIEGEGGIGSGTLGETKALLDAACACGETVYSEELLVALSEKAGSREYAFGFCGEILKVPAQRPAQVVLDFSQGQYEEAALQSPVSALQLPWHLEGRLAGNGFTTVGDVLNAGEEGLCDIRHFGPGKASEVMATLGRFLAPYAARSEEPAGGARAIAIDEVEIKELAQGSLASLTSKGYPVYASAIEACVRSWAQAAAQEGGPFEAIDAVAAVEGSESLLAACENVLSQQLCNASEATKNCEWPDPVVVPGGDVWSKAAERAVGRASGFAFDAEAREIKASPVTLDEWLAGLSENKASAVKMRLAGMSVADVAGRKGVTRQRAYQLISNALAGRPLLAEDRYRGAYKGYAFKVSEFCDVTGEPAKTYRYLAEAYGKCGQTPMKKALVDERVPEDVRRGIRSLIDKEYIFVDGERVRKDRESVLEHLVRRYATDDYISRGELRRLYLDFMRKHDLESLIIAGDLKDHSFASNIQRRPFVLYAPAGQGRGAVRYYDFEERDFSEFKRYVLGLGYENVEISASLIFERPDAADLMSELDLRDGYELHAVLREVFEDDKRVILGRAPHLSFGEADRESQVLGLIEEIGPVDIDALAATYRKRYGVREDTFRADFKRLASPYLRGGVYVASRSDLTAEQRAFIAAELKEDLVSAELVRSRFKAAFPEAPVALTGSDAAAEFGYAFDGDLLVKEGVDLAERCAQLIASRPLFKMGDPGFDRAVIESEAFKSELNKALRSFDVLECGKGEYANVACLAALDEPVTKEELADYVEKALEFMEPDRPYTVRSLRAEGFKHGLDRLERDLGMDDWLFSSLICLAYVGGRVRRTSWKDNVVFWRGIRPLTMPIIAEWAMAGKKGCAIAELCDAIEEKLGFTPSEYEMRSVLRRTDLVFKEDISMVFENEDAYEDKVREALGA